MGGKGTSKKMRGTKVQVKRSAAPSIRTLFAVGSVEAWRTTAFVTVHVWMTEAAVKADRRLDGTRVKTVVDVDASDHLVRQLQLTSVNRHLTTTTYVAF